jgi:hypothetical protein
MITPRHTKLQVPVELSRHVYHNNLVSPFSIYLYLKLFSDGKLHENSPVFKQMRKDLRLLDNRTFKKHVARLLELDWMGFNPISGFYFVRSFDYLRFIYTFKKRRASTFSLKDAKQVRKFLVGVILCTNVMGQEFYWERKYMRGRRTATKKTDVASHSKVLSEVPDYYGLSVKAIAKELGCSQTRASVLKNAAAKAGYIKVNKKFVLYTKLTRADFGLRCNINDMFPNLKGKLRVIPKSVKGFMEYHIMVQCHDEIIPQMRFKTVNKFNNLKVSPAIVRWVDNSRDVAA